MLATWLRTDAKDTGALCACHFHLVNFLRYMEITHGLIRLSVRSYFVMVPIWQLGIMVGDLLGIMVGGSTRHYGGVSTRHHGTGLGLHDRRLFVCCHSPSDSLLRI